MIDIKEIQRLLPHRYPFLLVDRVVGFEQGVWAEGYKNVSINEPFFNGHFPMEPILPGVLIVEAMAQLSGILGFLTEKRHAEEGYMYLLCGTDNARFKRQVVPGDRLDLRTELKTYKRNILKFSCHASVAGNPVATADLLVAEQKVG